MKIGLIGAGRLGIRLARLLKKQDMKSLPLIIEKIILEIYKKVLLILLNQMYNSILQKQKI